MEITTHVPAHFDRATFDLLSIESQCKVLALYEVAHILYVHHDKPLSPEEFYHIYDMDAHECYATCTSLLNSFMRRKKSERKV